MGMIIDSSGYPLMLLYCAAVGFILGAVCDIFRIQRISMAPSSELSPLKRRHKSDSALTAENQPCVRRGPLEDMRFAIIFVEDVLFFLIAAVFTTVLVYQANFGRVRWFALLGVFAGFALWYNTVGRLTIFFSEYIIYFIRKAVGFVLRTLYRLLAAPVMRLTKRLWEAVVGRSAYAMASARSESYKKKLERLAGRGFGQATPKERPHTGKDKKIDKAAT